MKPEKSSLLVLFLLLCSSISYSQSSDILLKSNIILEPGIYKLQMLVHKVNSSNSLVMTFNGKYIPPESEVSITKRNPSIQHLLDDIVESLSITYIIKNNYIILSYKRQKTNIKITGIITDKSTNEPLIGVNIIVANTLHGVISNENGEFEISLENRDHELRFSYIGYKTENIHLSKIQGDILDISLESESSTLSEVRITSKLRKFYNLDLGRPLEAIDAQAIENTNLSNVSDILNGRFAGVWATQTSGMPGNHQRIHIRGISSIFGSVDPLYVIDGVSVPMVNLHTLGIADLNAHDIENITILKDASSAALFGFQGGNGVILIDTKRGSKEYELTFYTKQGIEWFPGRYDLMNTKDFLTSMDSSNSKLDVNIRRFFPEYDVELADTDWQDHIFQTGKISEYQLSGSGTFKNTGFYISGNYLDNQGIIKNSSYGRYTLSANIERSFFKKLKFDFGYRGSIQENANNLDGYGGNSIVFEGINKAPCQTDTPDSMYYLDIENNIFAYRIYQEYDALSSYELVDSMLHFTSKTLDVSSNMIRGGLRFDINDNLYIKASSDLSFRKYHYLTDIETRANPLRGRFDNNILRTPKILYIESDENVMVLNHMLNVKWHKKVGQHELSFVGGLKSYKDLVYWTDIVEDYYGPVSEDNYSINISDDAYIRNSMSIHGPAGDVIRKLNSVLGNFNYNYKAKYFVSLAGNYENLIEGVNLDTKEFFPSLAFSWDIAGERLLRNFHRINHLNIYSSWGKAGNYPLNGLSKNIYSYETSVSWNGVINTGKYIEQLANHSLKQEIIEEYNVGISIDLFQNSRLTASFDVYNKLNRNLIMLREIPGYYGGGKMFYNVGEIETWGKEVSIEIQPVLTKNISWYSKFNFSTHEQTVNKLAIDSAIKVMNTEDILLPSFMIREHQGLGDIYGYKYLGQWTDDDEASAGNQYINVRGSKYLNADSSDTRLNDNDMVVIGNSLPKYIMNWYHSISYKSLTLDMLWSAVIGVEKYNATRAASYVSGTNREINTLINDSIQAFFAPTLNHYGLQSPYHGLFYQSSYFVEDASFIRLKQLVISYSPERKIFHKMDMRISLIMENLITLSHYKGYDPEATIYTDNNFSDNAIDRGAYPNPKSFHISLMLKF